MHYPLHFQPLDDPPPILADYPDFIEPLQPDRRLLSPPLIEDEHGTLSVRCWRWWYNARAIIEMENRLDPEATALLVVHPWGVDDGHGLRTPEPAGIAFFCTAEKNQLVLEHMRRVVNPLVQRLRSRVKLIAYSLPGTCDPVRKQLYASPEVRPSREDRDMGDGALHETIRRHDFRGEQLPSSLELDDARPVRSYFAQTPSTQADDHVNGAGFWQLPMPLSAAVEWQSNDMVFYDDDGYAAVRRTLRQRGIRHVLLAGYATDMCVIRTTCGYDNLTRDFNVFLVGDATLATFPGSTTPRFATQAALANAALTQLLTQAGWIADNADTAAALAEDAESDV